MKLLFMGSPAEVVAPLQYLYEQCQNSGHELLGLVSQPARPAGRKQVLTDPPLAAFAKKLGLMVWQPEKASRPEFLETLRSLEVDIIITAAYGQILSEAFLAIPKRATINIHPSMLPAYRGATPVPAALLDGREETGLTILFTVKALDAGPLIVQHRFPISPDECSGQLTQRLFEASGPLLLEAISLLQDPDFRGIEQDASQVSFCQKIDKHAGQVDWNQEQTYIYNRFRAYHPWPGSFTHLGEQRILLEAMQRPMEDSHLEPGAFTLDRKLKAIRVGTRSGDLLLMQVKPAGSKSIDALSFWNGTRLQEPGKFL